jgi:general secretion pathway protein M
MLALAVSVVICGVLYAAALEPAWLTRTRVMRELPALQQQLAQIEALREEVRILRGRGFGTQTINALRSDAQRTLEGEGVDGNAVIQDEKTIVVTAKAVPATSWFAWVDRFSREARVRVVFARVKRSEAPGVVDANAIFTIPSP